MKTLILNGCNRSDQYAMGLLEQLITVLGEGDAVPQIIDLEMLRIADCNGCFGCWTRTPGECVIRDDAPAVTAQLAYADRIIFFCPVVFGGFAPQLKRVLERSISLLLPFMRLYHGELHHPPRYKREYELCSVGILNQTDPEVAACFRERTRRLALNFNGSRFSWGTLVRGEILDSSRLRAMVAVREAL